MGDLIRYPVMKTVKDAAAIYGLPPTYIWTLCRDRGSRENTFNPRNAFITPKNVFASQSISPKPPLSITML